MHNENTQQYSVELNGTTLIEQEIRFLRKKFQ